MYCYKCFNPHKLKRHRRKGFYQIRILAIFGLYPWGCSRCGHVVLVTNRGNASYSNNSGYTKTA